MQLETTYPPLSRSWRWRQIVLANAQGAVLISIVYKPARNINNNSVKLLNRQHKISVIRYFYLCWVNRTLRSSNGSLLDVSAIIKTSVRSAIISPDSSHSAKQYHHSLVHWRDTQTVFWRSYYLFKKWNIYRLMRFFFMWRNNGNSTRSCVFLLCY